MPRKTTKKPTAKKAVTKKPTAKKTMAKKTAPKRKKYQTGGTAKPQMPRSQALARERAAEEARLAQVMEMQRQDRLPPVTTMPPEPEVSQYGDRLNAAMQRYRREQGLMELGNRQRAAAARARTRNRRGPTTAQAARNMAEYERAMRARQARNMEMRLPPPRPTPEPRPDLARPDPQPRPVRPPATSINRGNGIASPAIRNPNYRPPVRPTKGPQMRTPTPQELARLRANPNRPSMTNQVQTLNQGNALKRQRIQQQIAQLQAQLRQLGG